MNFRQRYFLRPIWIITLAIAATGSLTLSSAHAQTAATPTFNPAAGTYSSTQTVTISDSTSDSTIYYTTNGSAPSTSSAVYNGAITVSSTATVEAFATASGYSNSAVGSATYTIQTPAVLTSPTPSTQLTGTSVTFTWSPGNTATHFELWVGSNGAGTSNLYNSNSVTATSETVSGLPNNGAGLYVRLYYYINGTWQYASYTYTASGTPTLGSITTPTSGSTLGGTSVTFSWSPGNIATNFMLYIGNAGVGSDNLYYSGNVTATSETVSNLPNNGTTLHARLWSLINGSWESADYTYTASGTTIFPSLTTPAQGSILTGTSATFSWNPGNAATNFELWLGSTGVGSSNLYNSNSVTTTSETVSGLPTNGETVYVRLYWYYYDQGGWQDTNYTDTASTMETPTFAPAAGTYTSVQTVTISDAISGSTIYYTTNGISPTTNSSTYSIPITVSANETLEALATASGYSNSTVGTASYTIQAAPPTFSPTAGSFTSIQAVTISDSTSGATIYYTTDGSTPTTSSSVYGSAITVSSSGTLSAIATAIGYTNSTIASSAYSITLPTTEYLRPTLSGASSLTASGLVCHTGWSDSDTGANSMWGVYGGKTGAGPIGTANPIDASWDDGNNGSAAYAQALFQNWQTSSNSGSYSGLTVYVSVSDSIYEDDPTDYGNAYVYFSTNAGGSWNLMGNPSQTKSTLSATIDGTNVSNLEVIVCAQSTTNTNSSVGIDVYDIWTAGTCYNNGNDYCNVPSGTVIPKITWQPTPLSFTYGTALPPIPVGYIDSLPGNGSQLNGGGVAVDSLGNVYAASSETVQMLSATSGAVSTVAGGGTGCANQLDKWGDGCPATEGILSDPSAVAVDKYGNIYIADSTHYLIREIPATSGNGLTAGYIYTVAGTGECGIADQLFCVYTLGNGPAISEAIDYIYSLAVDTSGNVYFAEPINDRIRMIAATTTSTYTQGDVYTLSIGGELFHPEGIALDASNNIYIANAGNFNVLKIAASTGSVSILVGNGTEGYAGDGGTAISAELNYPVSLALDVANNLYIVDLNSNVIREVTANDGNLSSNSTISTVAGNGTLMYYNGGNAVPATSIGFGSPKSVAVDGSGNIYIGQGRSILGVASSNLFLGSTLLNATATDPTTNATVPGIFTYTPPPGTTLRNGQQTLSAIFTPTNPNYYTSATDQITVTVSPATPTLTITPISNQTFGVSPLTLSATSTTPGTIVFGVASGSPAMISGPTGSMLTITGAGTVTVTATLYPTAGDYANGTATPVSFTVSPATPTLTINPIPEQTYGASPFTVSAASASSGTVTYSVASGPATIAGSTVTITGVGTVTLNASQVATDNYTSATATPVSFIVSQATPLIAWATPLPITSGTALSSAQLDASVSSSITGSISYSSTSGAVNVGTILAAGTQPLTATFIPSGSSATDYTTASAKVYLIVNSSGTNADTGTATLTVNGNTIASTTYQDGSTPSSIAEALAGALVSGSPVTLTAVDDTLNIAATPANAGNDYSYTLDIASTNSAFTSTGPSFFATPSIGTLEGATSSGATGTTVYSYTVSTGGYDLVGNLLSYTDSSAGNPIMGTWTFTYDALNRLISGTPATGNQSNGGLNLCWSYDNFGNRTAQSAQPTACPTPPSVPTPTAVYNANNQLTGGNYTYDAAGNVTADNVSVHKYLYDGEGRICAVASYPYGTNGGMAVMTGYIYDADGTRVSKGSLTYFSCDMNPTDSTFNGFTPTNDYILGPSGQQVTEMGVGGTSDGSTTSNLVWQHTNIWAGGTLLGTYDGAAGTASADTTYGLHFYFNDPLGTRRVQTDYAGVVEQTCQSLPYGDGETCAPTPTENLFTGKERDTESGNDYFGARYYASSMGRFMSPDPMGNSVANFAYPQTWNLYAYALNNPLAFTDPTGLDCVYFSDDANSVESVDHDSSDSECGQNGGAWVTGYTDSSMIAQASNGNWNVGSYDQNNAYFTQVMAPNQSASWISNFVGFSCSGGSSCQTATSAPMSLSDLQDELSPTGGTVSGMLQWAVKQTNGVPFLENQSFGMDSSWCGHGGAGVPGASSGWSCMAHDYNYQLSGNTWPGHNADPDQSWSGGPQLQRINQQLCTHTSNILIQEFFSQGYNSTLGVGSTWGCQ